MNSKTQVAGSEPANVAPKETVGMRSLEAVDAEIKDLQNRIGINGDGNLPLPYKPLAENVKFMKGVIQTRAATLAALEGELQGESLQRDVMVEKREGLKSLKRSLASDQDMLKRLEDAIPLRKQIDTLQNERLGIVTANARLKRIDELDRLLSIPVSIRLPKAPDLAATASVDAIIPMPLRDDVEKAVKQVAILIDGASDKIASRFAALERAAAAIGVLDGPVAPKLDVLRAARADLVDGLVKYVSTMREALQKARSVDLLSLATAHNRAVEGKAAAAVNEFMDKAKKVGIPLQLASISARQSDLYVQTMKNMVNPSAVAEIMTQLEEQLFKRGSAAIALLKEEYAALT